MKVLRDSEFMEPHRWQLSLAAQGHKSALERVKRGQRLGQSAARITARRAASGRRAWQMRLADAQRGNVPCRMEFSRRARAEIRLMGGNFDEAFGVLVHASAGWLIGSSTFRARVRKSL